MFIDGRADIELSVSASYNFIFFFIYIIEDLPFWDGGEGVGY